MEDYWDNKQPQTLQNLGFKEFFKTEMIPLPGDKTGLSVIMKPFKAYHREQITGI